MVIVVEMAEEGIMRPIMPGQKPEYDYMYVSCVTDSDYLDVLLSRGIDADTAEEVVAEIIAALGQVPYGKAS